MKPFEYIRPRNLEEATTLLGTERDRAKVLAGGTDLLGELKDYIVTPTRLVAIRSISGMNKIEKNTPRGMARLGALVTLGELAKNRDMQTLFQALVQAIEVSAMPQIRSAATLGGNLCQRPRCWYYRDEHTLCLKKGGDRCYAVEGENQYHAILGGGPCHIVHPSDPAPALVALGASVVVHNGKAERTIGLSEFFVLPRENVYRENILDQNEIISHVLVPLPPPGTRSAYLKEREKDSYDWALSSCAAVLTQDPGGRITAARIVLGGVAPIPWRAEAAEQELIGKPLTPETAAAAARAAVSDARPMTKNAYKIPLTEAVVKRGILKTMA